jgi:uncharacterized C2H2 Zn-finger protein
VKVYTYYSEIHFSDQAELISVWKKSWERWGFEPVVLSAADAERHPYYNCFKEIVRDQSRRAGFALGAYGEACWMRWLAYAALGESESFIVCDYDVMNRNFPVPEKLPGGLVFWDGACPCVASGNSEDFLRFCKSVELLDMECFLEAHKKPIPHFHDQEFLCCPRCVELGHSRIRHDAVVSLYSEKVEAPLVHVSHSSIPGFNEAKRLAAALESLRYGGAAWVGCLQDLAQSVIRLNSLIERDVPVFLHIPRCGGTFVLSSMMAFLCYCLKAVHECGSIRQILVNDGGVIFRVIATCRQDVGFDDDDRYKLSVNLDGFFEILPKLEFVFSAMIEPAGVSRFGDGIFHEIFHRIQRRPMFFTCLRDPFERDASFFGYLKAHEADSLRLRNQSFHDFEERGASARLEGLSFEEYIQSDRLSDSWLIRTLLPQAAHICENEIDEACQLLADFRICGLAGLSEHLVKVLEDCYGEIAVPPDFEISSNRSMGGAALDKISEKAMAAFLEKTRPDYELYRRLMARAEC